MKSNVILWENIDWKASTSRIDNIQKRIYKASQNGDKGKVRFLQNLLVKSLDAKLLAVKKVTADFSRRQTLKIDVNKFKLPISQAKKMKLVRSLHIDGKTAPRPRVFILKSGKTEKKARSISIIRDRAKQKLVLMALEPQWEAQFELGAYGFRPGRSVHDVIEATFRHLKNHRGETGIQRKYILKADFKRCFDNINYDYLLTKLETFPRLTKQVSAWLKAGIFEDLDLTPEKYGKSDWNGSGGTSQVAILAPLLVNIALHGLETFLKNWILCQTWPVPKNKKHQLQKNNKILSLGVVRYVDDFIVIHRDKDILLKAKQAISDWLASTSGFELNQSQINITDSYQGFDFLGFSVINVIKNGKGTTKIYPSKQNQKQLIRRIGDLCRKYRSIATYDLITLLRPILIGWGNYFRFSECKDSFSKIDMLTFKILRSWVFRRDRKNGRQNVKEKYFPSKKTYIFNGKEHKDNWILAGTKKLTENAISDIYLPKLAWIQSIKYVSVRGNESVYNGNDVYWTMRTEKLAGFNTRELTLLKRQKGKCILCGGLILDKIVRIENVVYRAANEEKDSYNNMRLLHTHCHSKKTASDLIG